MANEEPGSNDVGDNNPDADVLTAMQRVPDEPGATADPAIRDLRLRLAAAARRIESVRSESEAAGNDVRIRLIRSVQALESDAIDIDARLGALADEGSDERRRAEDDLSTLEVDTSAAEARLSAALADASDDPRGDLEGEIHAIEIEAAGVRDRFRDRFSRNREPSPPAS